MLFDDVVGELMWCNRSQMWLMSCEGGEMLWEDDSVVGMGVRRTGNL